MAGRKPLPHTLHVLRNTDRKRRRPAPDVAVSVLPADTPPPSWMNAAAREEWTRVLPLLANAGIVTALDIDVVVAYCVTLAKWRSAEAELERTGATITT